MDGKVTTKIVEKLGSLQEVKEKYRVDDPIAWGKEYAKKLTLEEKEGKRPITMSLSPDKLIEEGKTRRFKGGYLFLQDIYYDLRLDKICEDIRSRHQFKFDLNEILSRLIYSRILDPGSKLKTFEWSKELLETHHFTEQQLYRALEILAQESSFIQAELYKNSRHILERNTSALFYDCTNYYFEIEQADGLRQYGKSKENRPNPIIQMGLFMDSDGIPLAFELTSGNTNEQTTLKPLEKKIIRDFELSKFVVCTDAGLASKSNRKFNNQQTRAFLTTQSLKKIKAHIKEWALDPTGWRLPGEMTSYNLNEIDEKEYFDHTFYKERWINEDHFEQRLIVSFSFKYRNYQSKIRQGQIDRALRTLTQGTTKLKKKNAQDPARFINEVRITPDGEKAETSVLSLDENRIAEEAKYDGFYGVCTNLTDDVLEIIQVNKRRWEIEECFRIMKLEFKARPVYLSNETRIKGHFLTCFIALLVFRILEKKLNEQVTCDKIIHYLDNMDFLEVKGEGYIPLYEKNEWTNLFHNSFGFRTDFEIVSQKEMKKIIKQTKS